MAKANASRRGRPRLSQAMGPATPAELAKFTGLVALLAIFADAAVGHALLWENDPYWTYWITKTLLIGTVFGLGTAWVGTGPWRGAAITAVHTLILTVYYWTLSPVGLPSHPEWLDLEHTWITGVPVHFGVIYLGYLLSLWIWRRRVFGRDVDAGDGGTVGRMALEASIVALGLVVVGGGVVSLVLWQFPGVTWFVVRLLLTIPFVFGWWVLAGRDRVAGVAGGVTLAFLWGTYSHFLGPTGLPDAPLRIFTDAPPPATVAWLSYGEEWLTSVPLLVLLFGAALGLTGRASRREGRASMRPVAVLAGAVAVLALGLGVVAWQENPAQGDRAELQASGPPRVEAGAWYSGDFATADGSLRLAARNRNPRGTPLRPHDDVDLAATIRHDGVVYDVRATEPMVEDPLGRHTTWWGVGFHEWHHGHSGIGSSQLPAVHSEVAVFALGEVRADGRLVAAGVPLHVMTSEGEELHGRLELNVGDEDIAVPNLPDGHLRVLWDDYSGGAPLEPRRTRNMLGTGVLIGLLALVGLTIRQDTPGRQALA